MTPTRNPNLTYSPHCLDEAGFVREWRVTRAPDPDSFSILLAVVAAENAARELCGLPHVEYGFRAYPDRKVKGAAGDANPANRPAADYRMRDAAIPFRDLPSLSLHGVVDAINQAMPRVAAADETRVPSPPIAGLDALAGGQRAADARLDRIEGRLSRVGDCLDQTFIAVERIKEGQDGLAHVASRIEALLRDAIGMLTARQPVSE